MIPAGTIPEPGQPIDHTLHRHTGAERVCSDGTGLTWHDRHWPTGPMDGMFVLGRIRTEQRRLAWTLASVERPMMPERVLTLLEDALQSLTEAGDQLERTLTFEPDDPHNGTRCEDNADRVGDHDVWAHLALAIGHRAVVAGDDGPVTDG